MAYVITKLSELLVYYNNECSDPRVTDLPLMKDPWAVLGLLGVYLLFVLKLGPEFMKDRKPFKLDRIIQIYNLVQVVVCAFLVVESFRLGYFRGYNWFCEPVDFSWNPIPILITRRCYIYFALKVLDLMDTVFFILRKKQNQVTFLHVYHHTGMVALCWGGVKYFPGGHSVFMGAINSFVHTIMYGYYFLTSYSPKYKQNLWWKKHITQLQIIQFFLVFVHFSILLFQPNCNFPKFSTAIIIPQNLFMCVLFIDFYIRTYIRKPRAEQLVTQTAKIVETNGCAMTTQGMHVPVEAETSATKVE